MLRVVALGDCGLVLVAVLELRVALIRDQRRPEGEHRVHVAYVSASFHR